LRVLGRGRASAITSSTSSSISRRTQNIAVLEVLLAWWAALPPAKANYLQGQRLKELGRRRASAEQKQQQKNI
jgi:hypothetical protein